MESSSRLDTNAVVISDATKLEPASNTRVHWPARIFCVPISLNWASGLLILLSMFLPFSRGCNGQTRYVVQEYENCAGVFDWLEALTYTAQHWYGMLIVALMVGLAIVASRGALGFVIAIHSAIAAIVIFGMSVVTVYGLGFHRAGEFVLVFLPIALLSGLILIPPIRRQEWLRYYSRLLILCAILSFGAMQFMVLMDSDYYIGYYLFVLGIVGLIVGACLFYNRVERNVIDSAFPKRPLRITTKSIAFWMIATAVLIAYYSWYSWLTGGKREPETESVSKTFVSCSVRHS